MYDYALLLETSRHIAPVEKKHTMVLDSGDLLERQFSSREKKNAYLRGKPPAPAFFHLDFCIEFCRPCVR